MAVTVAMASLVLCRPDVAPGPGTVLGLRPAVADLLWMSVLRGAGRSGEYAVAPGRGREGQGAEPSARLASRALAAIRLAPDAAEFRGWDAVLILGLLGDTFGASTVVEGMRQARPHDRWATMAEAAWLKWGIERDTAGALVVLKRASERGALDETGRRFARGLSAAAGETELEAFFAGATAAER